MGTGLPLSERTLGQALQSVGYETWALGKWHLVRPRTLACVRVYDNHVVPRVFGLLRGSTRRRSYLHRGVMIIITGTTMLPSKRTITLSARVAQQLHATVLTGTETIWLWTATA